MYRSGKRCSDEFKAEAAKQVIDQGDSVREVSTQPGVSGYSLHARMMEQRKAPTSCRKPVICSSEKRFFTFNLLVRWHWTPNRSATQNRRHAEPRNGALDLQVTEFSKHDYDASGIAHVVLQ